MGYKLKKSHDFGSEAAFRRAAEEYFSSLVTDEGFSSPPSLSALKVSLGLTERYWEECEKRYPETVSLIRNVIESYLEDELIKRKTGVTGIMFSLQSNFGWKEKRDAKTAEDMEVTIKVV